MRELTLPGKQPPTLEDDLTIGEILSKISETVKLKNKKYRILDVKQAKTLNYYVQLLILNTAIAAITNKHLQSTSNAAAWANKLEGRNLVVRIIRQLILANENIFRGCARILGVRQGTDDGAP